ncbi:glycosyltransferase family 2 protein [Streptomyces sp. TRM 70351]|uniref:glycosyltransferase family 2 protein n=1 Tax=Streptomyces sp. TRM 70351 TaxID=3116552 RepID=UPI003FCD6D14
MSVGVVIATRDRAERLARTLDRLTALPERPPVVVVDNASADHTRRLVAERFPGVRLLTLPRNAGAAARTVGAAALTTPVVAFSDDDSWWEPGSLATAARLLRDHPRLGLLAARTRVGPDGGADPLNAVLAGSPLGRPADLPGPEVLGFLGCAAVARRSAFLDAGGYHPLLGIGAEETLLAYDLSARGWGVAYCPEVTAWHHPDDGPRPERPVQVRRNEVLTCWLRRPLPLAARRTAALAARARTDEVARRALGGVLARLPAALRLRQPLPPWTENAVRQLEGDARAR